MKTTITFLLFLCFFFTIEAQQNFDCDDDQFVTISEATCNTNGTPETDDDFLSFTVTADDINSAFISSLPADVTVDPNNCLGGTELDLDCVDEELDGTIMLSVPSIDCMPINFTLDFFDNNCENEDIVVSAALSIPTIGQWGIILLGLICAIFGINKIRQSRRVSVS